MGRPVELEYKKVGPGVWRKWNPILLLWSELRANYENGRIKSYTVRRWQPDWVMKQILDRNVAMQNEGKSSHKDDLIMQTTSLPIAVHQQLMEQCGFKAGQGYDEKKFRQIVNDRDNYKLKTFAGKL